MGLSYKDAAFMLAMLEKLASGDKDRVEGFIKEAQQKEIGGSSSSHSWERMLELLRESQADTKSRR